MAAYKPEILISQLVVNIAKKFQLLYNVFGVGDFSGAICVTIVFNRKWKIEDGGL